SARFGGVSQNLFIPMGAVGGIFARENGQGMFFEGSLPEESLHQEPLAGASAEKVQASKKPTLTVVK
ncbi:MAG: ClpXP protease specificity-enhancing factor, partial [Sphingomonadales bacterium]|nr:ClpXP protease specificity-enhancing factor [Sphingomonadales bacterium]